MRPSSWIYLALGLVLLLPAGARAQIDITARVGFPSGAESGKFKAGTWVPVWATLVNRSDAPVPPGSKLIVEAPDSDDQPGQYSRDMPELPPGARESVLTYIRIGNPSGDVVLTVQAANGKVVATGKARMEYQSGLGIATPLYLSLGSPLPDLKQAIGGGDKPALQHQGEVVFLSNVIELPTQWFGYEGVDLLILNTSRQEFVEQLLKDAPRRQALTDWVRRGGRLVISLGAGKHAQVRAELLKQLGIIDCEMVPAEPGKWQRLESAERWARDPKRGEQPFVSSVPGNAIETANLQVKRGAIRRIDVLIPKPTADPNFDDRPLVVQTPYGLGRVLVTAFDLDEAPFTSWPGHDAFWTRLVEVMGARAESDETRTAGNWKSESSQLRSRLQDSLETFDEVPVISFGWVALFILLYIVVVGPLDYWFLKKVVKRLELTWVTFPVVVLTISVAAYFTAYYLKGNDLRINKLDIVEIVTDAEPDANRTSAAYAHGVTWFTLFSPHIKHYTIALEPGFPGWAPEPANLQANPFAALVQPLDRAENAYGGMGRQSATDLFRHAYEYEPDQGAVVGVPIQVWSTKSFTGTWQARLPPGNSLFRAQLRQEQGGGATGWIESGLPVPLQEVVLFYGGDMYPLDTLQPHQRIDGLKIGRGQGRFRDNWFGEEFARAASKTTGTAHKVSSDQQPASALMKGILFHDANRDKRLHNDGLRDLDQSWRILDQKRSQEEAVLLGRIAPLDGDAEELTQNGISATRLWFDDLPSSGKPRPRLPGKLSQETYVRVYIPILK